MFFNHQLNNQFQNFQQQKNNSFQNLQKQPEAFQQSQPKPRFKEPEPQPPKDNCRGKRVVKQATVDLVDEDEEEEEHIRQCARWTCDEEILLTHSTAKGRKFQLEHAWRILKGRSKWDAPKPLDTEDHIEIFGPDTRPRLAGKARPAKKTKSETTESSGGSASGSISDFLSEDLRRKLQAGTSAYEAKKQKELAMKEFKEIEFLTIDADKLPEPKAGIIQRRQEIIIAKYAQQ
ncbi:hypothetical protein Tco_0410832 [Tanacetum coccineum]